MKFIIFHLYITSHIAYTAASLVHTLWVSEASSQFSQVRTHSVWNTFPFVVLSHSSRLFLLFSINTIDILCLRLCLLQVLLPKSYAPPEHSVRITNHFMLKWENMFLHIKEKNHLYFTNNSSSTAYTSCSVYQLDQNSDCYCAALLHSDIHSK